MVMTTTLIAASLPPETGNAGADQGTDQGGAKEVRSPFPTRPAEEDVVCF